MIRATFSRWVYGLFTASVSWKTNIFLWSNQSRPTSKHSFGVQSSARFGKQSPLSKDDMTYKGTQAIACTYRIYSLIIRYRLRRSGQIFEREKTFTEPPFVYTGPCKQYWILQQNLHGSVETGCIGKNLSVQTFVGTRVNRFFNVAYRYTITHFYILFFSFVLFKKANKLRVFLLTSQSIENNKSPQSR